VRGLASSSDPAASVDGAGYGVLDDGEGPARPPPTKRRLLAVADRPIQYVCLAHPLSGRFPGGATRCLNCGGI
jgi:hypothetical protein